MLILYTSMNDLNLGPLFVMLIILGGCSIIGLIGACIKVLAYVFGFELPINL